MNPTEALAAMPLAARFRTLSTKEACAFLGCRKKTLHRARKAGKITPIVVNQRVFRWSLVDLAAFYAEKTGGLSTTQGKRIGGRPWSGSVVVEQQLQPEKEAA